MIIAEFDKGFPTLQVGATIGSNDDRLHWSELAVTLRDIGEAIRGFQQSVQDFKDGYITAISTQNVLDWSIAHLAFTAFIGLILMYMAFVVLLLAYALLKTAWEATGLPYLWVRLDQRFGQLYAALIMIAGTVVFFIVLGLLAALWELTVQ